MCGIVGIIANKTNNYSTLLFECLKQMQNRGYDSAGICSISKLLQFKLDKYASTVSENAFDLLEPHVYKHAEANIGMGHTRWSTHGPKTTENSHPHISMGNKFAIVHNGIIENYAELKYTLLDKGFTFKSQTDTEVIVNLLEDVYDSDVSDNFAPSVDFVSQCIQKTVQMLKGTWGLVILCTDTPNTLYCTRHGSPLLISKNENMCIVASEQAGFNNLVNNYFALENGDICVINKTDDAIITRTTHTYKLNPITACYSASTPHPYPHWTLKEICEQPQSIDRVMGLGGRIISPDKVKLGGLMSSQDDLLKIEHLILLGCGTSYNAGLIGMHYFKDLCDFDTVQLFDGADFNVADIPRSKNKNVGVILLSQSGETKDLHRCIQIAQQHNIFTIGVVNVVDSMIAREVNCGCYLNAGKEVGVASTKSFTSQCVILSMIAIWFAQCKEINGNKRRHYIKNLFQLKGDVSLVLDELEEQISMLINVFDNKSSCFVLGRGRSEAIAREGSLKIKEISYIHSESYSTASLKHGPFALLCENFPVIMIMLKDEHWAKNNNAYNEIKSRHATVVTITDNVQNLASDDEKKIGDYIIKIPENGAYKEVLASIVLQMLAYKLSVRRGWNPDMPKNLAKVVTVE